MGIGGSQGSVQIGAELARRDAAGKASLEQILTESDCTAFVRLSLRLYHAVPSGCNNYWLGTDEHY